MTMQAPCIYDCQLVLDNPDNDKHVFRGHSQALKHGLVISLHEPATPHLFVAKLLHKFIFAPYILFACKPVAGSSCCCVACGLSEARRSAIFQQHWPAEQHLMHF